MKVLSVDGLSKLITLMKEEFASSSSLSTVATSGSYNDLSNKPTILVVDQTYNASSSNAQSGVAINGAGFLKNNTTRTASVAIIGSSTDIMSTSLGASSSSAGYGTAIGWDTSTSRIGGLAIGATAKSTAIGAIQLAAVGNSNVSATNNDPGTLYVALYSAGGTGTSGNYKLLGCDGKIPDDRLNTTIARTSQLPSASDLLPSQSGNSGKFLTTNGTTASWATVTQPSIATTSTAGLVKPDGTTITITNDGTISAAGGSAYAMVIVDYTAEEE